MGTKFANIQVRNSTLEEVERALSILHQCKPDQIDSFRVFKALLGERNTSEDAERLIKELCRNNDEEKKKYFIGEISNKWIVILNTSFEWESVKDFALKLSECLAGLILSIGYFDDDVLELDLFEGGKIITNHASGDVELYGIKKRLGQADLMIHRLGINISEMELMQILRLSDLIEKVNRLEVILGTLLWLKADWFDDFDIEFKNKFKVVSF